MALARRGAWSGWRRSSRRAGVAVHVDGSPAAVHGRSVPAAPGAGQPARQRRGFRAAGQRDRAARSPATVRSWTITVADRGPGVPDFALERVFERFYSLPRPDGGSRSSGLGLCFVAEVAALHGGDATLGQSRGRRRGGDAVAAGLTSRSLHTAAIASPRGAPRLPPDTHTGGSMRLAFKSSDGLRPDHRADDCR